MVDLFFEGLERIVYVYGGCDSFVRWARKMNRPPMSQLVKVIQWLANRTQAELLVCGHIWKYERGTKPKIFVIRSDQARIYCCLWKGNIVMLDWVQKKQQRASRSVLKRAMRRTTEVFNSERENKTMDGGTRGDA